MRTLVETKAVPINKIEKENIPNQNGSCRRPRSQ